MDFEGFGIMALKDSIGSFKGFFKGSTKAYEALVNSP